MAFTKITAAGIGSTETVTLDGLSVINNESIGGNLTVTGNATIGGVLTYEDVTNVDSVGLITARNGIVVGSGITLSKDGDGFFTGIVTATTFNGAFSGDGSALTGVANTDVIFPDKISLPDSSGFAGSINVGLGSDLQISHNGSKSMIRGATATNIDIKTAADFFVTHADTDGSNGENCIVVRGDGEVELYHDGSKKLETASGGVTVTGTVAATSYTGDGSSLTGIAAGITTEAASISGITTYLNLSKDDHELVVTGNNTISVIGGAQGTSHTLRLQNSGISTVTLDSTYFKFPSGASPALPTADGSISLISFTVHKAGAVGVNTVLLAGASVSFS